MKNRANDHSRYRDWINPNETIPYEKNAKEHTEKQIRNIANSIKRFGWWQECVLTSDYVVVIGHGRRLAAIKLGCMMPYQMIDKTADELTDKDIRELRIADNQTNSETGYLFDIMAEEIEDLEFEGFDFDFDIDTAGSSSDSENVAEHGSLSEMFLIPPFSVLRGDTGPWLERKRAWIAAGLRSELGRG